MTTISRNTNNLLTVDSLVRTYITERGMIWHDYIRVLSVALSGVRDLAKGIDIGSNYKAKEIDVDQSNAAYLPGDCVKVSKVCIEAGDKILGMAEVNNMNPLQKFEDGYAVKRSTRERLVYQDLNFYSNINSRGEFVGRYYGTPSGQPYLYQVFGNRIQLDANLDMDCVLVIYTTNGTSASEINMIHPWAEEPLKAWIDWKYPDMSKGIYEKRSGSDIYYNAKSALKGAIYGLTYEDYMEIVRKNNVLTFKG